jgi:hypothetical protein
MQAQMESWEKTIPSDLVPATKHLRDSFGSAHFNFGWPTTELCYCRLHNGNLRLGNRDIQQYVDVLPALQRRVGAVATQRFLALLSKETPPAIFRGFFGLYMDGLKFQIRLVFNALFQIGMTNSTQISQSPIEWATLLSRDLVESERHHIPIWIKDVCDEHPWDPEEDPEEQIFWRKWQAPSFLIMEPSRHGIYDPQKVWERKDSETSSRWLGAFTNDYILILGIEIERAAGTAALRRAMTPTVESTAKELQVSQTFNVNGANARVNIGSVDNSTNVVHQGTPFSEIRKAIEEGIAEGIERTELLKTLAELEQAKDGRSALERYQSFISAAANHVTILAPYLPMLGHWVHSLMVTAI